jgi:hypothetical protein
MKNPDFEASASAKQQVRNLAIVEKRCYSAPSQLCAFAAHRWRSSIGFMPIIGHRLSFVTPARATADSRTGYRYGRAPSMW